MSEIYIFVYGTLMSGFTNEFANYLHENAKSLGRGITKGVMYDIGKYPGAVFTDNHEKHCIVGEIFELNSTYILKKLDDYEEFGERFTKPNEYVRIQIPVICNQKIINCWFYNYNHQVDDKTIIKTGNYKAYLINNPPKTKDNNS